MNLPYLGDYSSSSTLKARWVGVTQEELDNNGRIHKSAYIGTITALFVLCWIAALIRFYIRLFMQRIFSLDDVFLLLGMGCITTTVGILWTMMNETYTAAGYLGGKGLSLALQPGYLDLVFQYMKDNNIILMVAWAGICCVKLSFLFLFRKLIDRITYMMIYWWIVLLYVLAISGYGLAVYILVCPYFFSLQAVQCVTGPGLHKILAYSISQITLDIVGDILILLIPLRLIYKVPVPLRQKLFLCLSLCLTIVMILITICRGAGMLDAGQFDSIWDGYWNIVSCEVGLIMTSATAFRALYVSRPAPSMGSERKDGQEQGVWQYWWEKIRYGTRVEEMSWMREGKQISDTTTADTTTLTSSNDRTSTTPEILQIPLSVVLPPDHDHDQYLSHAGKDDVGQDDLEKGWFGQCPWERPRLVDYMVPPPARPSTAITANMERVGGEWNGTERAVMEGYPRA